MEYVFSSERLGFRNWIESDFDPFSIMNADPEVMEFFPNTLSKEDSDGLIKRLQKEFETNGITFYAVDELSSQEFIGMIGMIHMKMDVPFAPCIEVGWRQKKLFGIVDLLQKEQSGVFNTDLKRNYTTRYIPLLE